MPRVFDFVHNWTVSTAGDLVSWRVPATVCVGLMELSVVATSGGPSSSQQLHCAIYRTTKWKGVSTVQITGESREVHGPLTLVSQVYMDVDQEQDDKRLEELAPFAQSSLGGWKLRARGISSAMFMAPSTDWLLRLEQNITAVELVVNMTLVEFG